MGDLDHRRQGRLDMALGAALGIHEGADRNWDHVSWEDPEAVRARRRWPAAPAEGTAAFHHVEVA